jgi:membrane protein
VQQIQAIEPFGTLILYVSKIAPYLMIILAFTFLYKFIPNTRVEFGPALIGAVVAGVLWVTLGKLFASFVASSSNYTAIYSSFAILFFFMLWLYLAWFILLTGSQVAYYLQHPNLVRFGGQDYSLSPRLRDKEGLWLMTVIAKQFYLQKPALNVQELEIQTGLAGDLTQDLLSILEEGKLIVELDGEIPCYQPAQDIAKIQVKTILKTLRIAEEAKITVTTRQVGGAVERLLQKLNDAQEKLLADLDLRALVIEELAK